MLAQDWNNATFTGLKGRRNIAQGAALEPRDQRQLHAARVNDFHRPERPAEHSPGRSPGNPTAKPNLPLIPTKTGLKGRKSETPWRIFSVWVRIAQHQNRRFG
jgi:hypothetical protein